MNYSNFTLESALAALLILRNDCREARGPQRQANQIETF